MDNPMLLEPSPYEADCGELVGRDPRRISSPEWESAGMVDAPMGLRAIRAKCMDCCADSFSEVRKCTATGCPLWPLRMGVKPKGLREARGEKIKTQEE